MYEFDLRDVQDWPFVKMLDKSVCYVHMISPFFFPSVELAEEFCRRACQLADELKGDSR